MEHSSKRIFYGWWVVAASFAVAFYVGGTVIYGFTAFFEPIAEDFSWSYTQVSVAASLRGLEMGFFAPIMGFLVDRFGSRKLAVCGTIAVGSGLVLLSRTSSLPTFYGSFVILALGVSACTGTVLMTAVANWFRKNVGRALGIMASGFGASGLLVLLVVRLIDTYQWRNTLLILGLGMWVIVTPLALAIRRGPEQYGYLPDGEQPGESTQNRESGTNEITFGKSVRDTCFWQIAGAEGIRMMIVMAVITHVMPYLSSEGVGRSSAALITTAIPLLSIIGRFGFGWVGDILDKRYVMAAAYFLMGAGLLAFSHIHVAWLVIAFLLLFSPAYGGLTSLRGAILREYFGRTSFGRIIGVLMGLAALCGMLGPAVAGWVFDNSGSYRIVWLAFSGVTAIAAVLMLRVRRLPQGLPEN